MTIYVFIFTIVKNTGNIMQCKLFTKEKNGDVMNNKNIRLNKEVECLKKELYELLENEPWAKHDILKISRSIDNLILQFYTCD